MHDDEPTSEDIARTVRALGCEPLPAEIHAARADMATRRAYQQAILWLMLLRRLFMT